MGACGSCLQGFAVAVHLLGPLDKGQLENGPSKPAQADDIASQSSRGNSSLPGVPVGQEPLADLARVSLGKPNSSIPAGDLVGKWKYDDCFIYEIRKDGANQWRFFEQHECGRKVSGVLRPKGGWLQGLLVFTDSLEECGTIRLYYSQDVEVILSNFKAQGENNWSSDIIARREDDDSVHGEVHGEVAVEDHKRSSEVTVGPRTSADSSTTEIERRGPKIPTRVMQKLQRALKKKNREDRATGTYQSSVQTPQTPEEDDNLDDHLSDPVATAVGSLVVAPSLRSTRPWCSIFEFDACCRRPPSVDMMPGEEQATETFASIHGRKSRFPPRK